jgi:hypothetical protein
LLLASIAQQQPSLTFTGPGRDLALYGVVQRDG